jgi:uncharacterized protein (DUF983 family)
LKPETPNYPTVLARAWRLRCPRCGLGPLFKNWISMYRECRICELRFEREPGYFLGSIYVNYGITAALVTAGYMTLVLTNVTTPRTALWTVTAFAFLFPIWFFRYARSLWLGFDHYWDPLPEESARDAPLDDHREPWER